MRKADRFEGLKDLADGRENGAARRLADSLREMQSKAAELKQLHDYLDSYAKAGNGDDSTVDTARWRNTRQFVSRLNDAVTQQENELAIATARYEQEAERWRACHQQTNALQQLVDRYCQEELQDTARREQKECDEHVTRNIEE